MIINLDYYRNTITEKFKLNDTDIIDSYSLSGIFEEPQGKRHRSIVTLIKLKDHTLILGIYKIGLSISEPREYLFLLEDKDIKSAKYENVFIINHFLTVMTVKGNFYLQVPLFSNIPYKNFLKNTILNKYLDYK